MSIVRSAILLSGAEYLVMALALAEAMMLSRALGSDGIGQFSLVRQTIVFAYQVASLGLPTASIYAINARKFDASRTTVTTLYACLAMSAVTGVVLWILFALGHRFFGALTTWAILACVSYVPLILAAQCFHQINMAWMRAIPMALTRAVPHLCYVMVVAGLFFLARPWMQVDLMVSLPVIVAVVGLAVAYSSLWKHISLRARPDLGFLRVGIPIGLQIVATDMLTVVNGYVALMVLRVWRGFSDVGYFSRASQVAMLVSTAGVGFYNLLYSRWSSLRGEQQRLHVQWTLGLVTAAAVIGCGMVFLLAHYVILILYGREFLPAVGPTRLLVGGSAFFLIARVLQGLFTAHGQPFHNIITLGIGGLSNLLLCVALVPTYGIHGAAVAGLLSYLATGVAAVSIACARYHLSLLSIVVPSREATRLVFNSLMGRKSSGSEPGGTQ